MADSRKRVLLVGALLLAAVLLKSESQPRIERLTEQEWGSHSKVEIFHDREGGMEFVCITKADEFVMSNKPNSYAISCLPTGRNWK